MTGLGNSHQSETPSSTSHNLMSTKRQMHGNLGPSGTAHNGPKKKKPKAADDEQQQLEAAADKKQHEEVTFWRERIEEAVADWKERMDPFQKTLAMAEHIMNLLSSACGAACAGTAQLSNWSDMLRKLTDMFKLVSLDPKPVLREHANEDEPYSSFTIEHSMASLFPVYDLMSVFDKLMLVLSTQLTPKSRFNASDAGAKGSTDGTQCTTKKHLTTCLMKYLLEFTETCQAEEAMCILGTKHPGHTETAKNLAIALDMDEPRCAVEMMSKAAEKLTAYLAVSTQTALSSH